MIKVSFLLDCRGDSLYRKIEVIDRCFTDPGVVFNGSASQPDSSSVGNAIRYTCRIITESVFEICGDG